MARFMPPEANLEHVKNEAKALHKAHARKDAKACGVLRNLRRFRNASGEEILAAEVPLTEMQFALALDYGFGSWAELRTAACRGRPFWIEGIPTAKGSGNGYVRGLETLLACEGSQVGYERLMGLSGMAFILQADAEHRWQGKVDAGWWPLDPWGLKLNRQFLSKAIGFELKEVGAFYDSHDWPASGDARREHYLKHIHAHVVRQIDSGKPVLVTFCPTNSEFGYVITGYDKTPGQDHAPVWGRCAVDTEGGYGYCADWPLGVIMVGERIEPLDRDAADTTALRQAVALADDQAGPAEERWSGRRYTGQKAWAAWTTTLRNAEEPTEDRFHWNVRGNLIWNRTAAVAYLTSVAERRDGQAADELRSAADAYVKMLEASKRLSPSGISKDSAKRRQFADDIERIAGLEREAILHVKRALDAMQ